MDHKGGLKEWFLERFSLKTFTGLPLTTLISVLVIDILVLLDFVEDLINSKSFVNADAAAASFITLIRTPLGAQLFYIFTQAGNNITIFAVCLFSVLFFIWKKKYHYITGLLIAVAGSAVTIVSGKNTFHILRPVTNAYYELKSFSFPSGHATYAVSLYGFLFYLLIRNIHTLPVKILIIIASLLFILLLGGSRIYLGVHFFSDVLGGFMLGTLWLLLAISIVEWKEYSLLRK